MKQEETKFKERVVDRLKTIPNAWFYKTHEISRSGVPDIIMCAGGRMIALELKTEKGKTSKLQAYNLERIKQAGGFTAVMTPKNFVQLTEQIRLIAQGGVSGGSDLPKTA